MARTYRAEGRKVAKFFTGLFVLISLFLYIELFFTIELGKIAIPMFFLFVLISVILGETIGAMWTRYRRKERDLKRKNSKAKSSIKHNDRNTESLGNRSYNQSKKLLTDQELLTADIDTLSGPDFERLIAMYYRDQGYQVEHVGGSGDNEVDLVLKGKDGLKIAVQCKRWKGNVGNNVVLRLKAGKQYHGCYDAWIITTAQFTPAALEAAEKLRIRLISGLEVHDMINKWRKKKGLTAAKSKSLTR